MEVQVAVAELAQVAGAVPAVRVEHVGALAGLSAEMLGAEVAFIAPPANATGLLVLGARGMTIAGGTSEITRNQIAERILGLPRDPLIK